MSRVILWRVWDVDEVTPNRALAIVAHPDDVEYFCAGTLGKWVQNGCTVSYVIASSGEKGGNDVDKNISQIIRVREQEQRSSACVLGVHDLVFLRCPDSELSFVNLKDLRGEFVRHIRRTRAEIILTHDPFVRLKRQHSDHRIVGQLALDASFPIAAIAQCYSEQILEEGLEIWQPNYVFLFGTDEPNHAVDISATLELKIKALQQHCSQQNAFAGGFEKRLLWKAQTIGQAYGLGAAEEFLRVKVGATMPPS
jgi:LmbE family N-acetylglucosaminyl deacetylase